MIKAVVIPPAMDHPLRCVELDPKEISVYEGVTGGNLQTYVMRNPAMTLYSNSASKTPLNVRATLMLWVHNRNTAYHTMVSGQALFTGNDEGADVDVPDEIMELVFKAQQYTVEVNGKGDGMTYEELPYAYAAAVYHMAPSIESAVSVPAVMMAKVRAWCNS